MARIHYSIYWGSYSRVLTDRLNDRRGNYVEVNLTPVNPQDDRNWQEISRCWIRSHGTMRDKREVDTNQLERPVFDRIGDMVGKDVRHWLLTADILPMIDWDKHNRASNGGASLFASLKEGYELPPFIKATTARYDDEL